MNTRQVLSGLMLAATLGLLSWNAYTTQALTTAVARIDERLQASTGRAADQATQLVELRTRVTALEIQFAEFRRSQPGRD